MSKSIKISIPTPCHENWGNMAPADRGRFCAVCRETVIDFSAMADREVAATLKANPGTCGNFMASQLDRDLVIPKERNSIWVVAGAAAIAVLAFGTPAANAQQAVPTEQSSVNRQTGTNHTGTGTFHTLKGQVVSQDQAAMPNVTVHLNQDGKTVVTDKNGYFTLEVQMGDTLYFSRKNQVDVQQVITQEILEKPTFTLYSAIMIRGKVLPRRN